jgi:dipeptidyl aminopeptidase/acylaminoacyl peptidase
VGIVAGIALGGAALSQVPVALPKPVADLAHLPERLYTRWLPPSAGTVRALASDERAPLQALARRLGAAIVWSSNREGNHELYLLDLRSREVRRLTRHPNVDFFSRFSPDGRQIVFLRSQRAWASFRDMTVWDVYLINADGSGERLLARSGYHPSWSPDGQSVVFVRGNRLFRVEVATGQETMLLDGARPPLSAEWLETPNLAADGHRLAVTVRSRSFGGVGILDLETRTFVRQTEDQACQLDWGAAGDLVWVDTEGRGGTRIMAAARPGEPGRVLMDHPGPYSHEYFPRLSRDGRWLVWGAAAQGHEHDRADYEILLWEVGTPWESAVRLTHHTGNDQWPDIHVRHIRPTQATSAVREDTLR